MLDIIVHTLCYFGNITQSLVKNIFLVSDKVLKMVQFFFNAKYIVPFQFKQFVLVLKEIRKQPAVAGG